MAQRHARPLPIPLRRRVFLCVLPTLLVCGGQFRLCGASSVIRPRFDIEPQDAIVPFGESFTRRLHCAPSPVDAVESVEWLFNNLAISSSSHVGAFQATKLNQTTWQLRISYRLGTTRLTGEYLCIVRFRKNGVDYGTMESRPARVRSFGE